MLQLGSHDHRTQVTKLVIYTASLVGKIFPESIATKNRQRLVCLLQVSYSFFSMFTGTHSYSCWKEAFQEFCKRPAQSQNPGWVIIIP